MTYVIMQSYAVAREQTKTKLIRGKINTVLVIMQSYARDHEGGER